MTSKIHTFRVKDYDLAATLTSGQTFRWRFVNHAWVGVIDDHWVALNQTTDAIHARVAHPVATWDWLSHYLQLTISLSDVINTFPRDPILQQAVAACHGLRLLRQDPWECLASFILSSTKQVCQIEEIIALLCERFGDRLVTPPSHNHPPTHRFPSAARLAQCCETDLRACKMGFRAPYLLETARQIVHGTVKLSQLRQLDLAAARRQLIQLPGVGRKIADCVLLFACGFATAFPVDVWIWRALLEYYFPGHRPSPAQLHDFINRHFGPYAGFAQQYLYHFMRQRNGRAPFNARPTQTTELSSW